MVAALDEQIAKFIIWTLYFIGLYFSLFWLSVLLFNSQENSKKKRTLWPEVTIILPMYNESKSANWTLNSVFSLDYPENKLKVICVNDGSTDDTLEILHKLKKKYPITIIDKKNGGKHTALNEALKLTTSQFFVCLDADSSVEPYSLKNMLEEVDAPNVAAVMPIMRVHKPKNVLQRVQWLEYNLNVFYKYLMGKLDCIHVVPGPFSLYKTRVIKEIGGFKKAHMTEDFEITLRLQKNHYKLKQCLDAVVYTKSPKTLKNFLSQRTRWYHGTILNVKDYWRVFFFKKEYGEFGVFQMPFVAVTGVTAILGLFTLLYLFLKETYLTIRRWALTNFDFYTYISTFEWRTSWLDFHWQVLFMTSFLFLLVFISLYFAFATSKQKVNLFRHIKHYFMFLYYFFFYSFVLAYVWLKVFSRLIFRKKNSWDKVND